MCLLRLTSADIPSTKPGGGMNVGKADKPRPFGAPSFKSHRHSLGRGGCPGGSARPQPGLAPGTLCQPDQWHHCAPGAAEGLAVPVAQGQARRWLALCVRVCTRVTQ